MPGIPGPRGADGIGVAASALLPGDSHCPAGGVRYTSATGDHYVCTGIDGSAGAQGPQGQQGPQGPQGLQGLAGVDGLPGPQGPIGPQGGVGAPGVPGPRGADGTGVAASALLPGDSHCPAGGVRYTSATGDDYVCAGIDGSAGAQGPQGADGLAGLDGAQGPQGAQGSQGVQGVPGPQGPAGLAGEGGPAGPQGPPGADGITRAVVAAASGLTPLIPTSGSDAVKTVTLPAGTYALFGKIFLFSQSVTTSSVFCDLAVDGGATLDTAGVHLFGGSWQPGSATTLSAQGAATIPPGGGSVSLRCNASTGPVYAQYATITALQVSSLSLQ